MCSSLRRAASCALLTLTACSVAADEAGSVELAVTNAPADALCLRVTAGASRTVVRTFDLTPGQTSTFLMDRLPVGAVEFKGEAFAVACAAVTSAEIARWISDPVTETIAPGVVAQVTLLLQRNGRASVGVDFEPDPDAGVVDAAPPVVTTFEKRIAAGEDDAEEFTTPTSGGVDINSSDLEMTRDIPAERSQVIGLRFSGVDVPPGATIVAAHIQFTAKLQADGNGAESDPATTTLTVRGQAADNPTSFAAAGPGSTEISGRPATGAQTIWSNIPRWMAADAAGPDQRTASLAAVIAELVNRPGWARGNAMVFVVTGTGTRSAHSFNVAAGARAPLLHVEWTTGPFTPPDAGPPPDAAATPPDGPPADIIPGVSSQPALMVPTLAGVRLDPILTSGDVPASGTGPSGRYRMVGEPDGLGAFDNGDDTFTVLMQYELGAGSGLTRAHGATGSLVTRWTIRKSDLFVLHGEDLVRQIALWDRVAGVYRAPATGIAFSRLCSADLPPRSATFNAASGLGYDGRLFISGEEAFEGRAFAHGLDGTSYELPRQGRAFWENVVLNPGSGDSTIAVSLDDQIPGQLYVYVGTKTSAGLPVERAGLLNGHLFGVRVPGLGTESASTSLPAPVPFELVDLGDASNPPATGSLSDWLERVSNDNGVTLFARPEDGAWDPSSPNDFYFATTSTNRLWKLHFADLANAAAGGTASIAVDGQGMFAPDNVAISARGEVLIQEDPGNGRLAKLWRYRIATGVLDELAHADPQRFLPSSPNYIGTTDEENSGVIDASEIFGPGHYLLDVQVHRPTDAELVTDGQLLRLFVPAP